VERVSGIYERAGGLRRYERPREEPVNLLPPAADEVIPYERAEAAIASCGPPAGSCALLRGLLRVGCTRVFPGGGTGIEYGSLLKTAARPDYLTGRGVPAGCLRDPFLHGRQRTSYTMTPPIPSSSV
jgi:hypothetical protein